MRNPWFIATITLGLMGINALAPLAFAEDAEDTPPDDWVIEGTQPNPGEE